MKRQTFANPASIGSVALLLAVLAGGCSRKPALYPPVIDLGGEASPQIVRELLADHPGESLTLRTNPTTEGVRQIKSYSRTYTVSSIYRSMEGPQSTVLLQFDPKTDKKETAWVTGYHAQVVSSDGQKDLSLEFLCHSNLDTTRAYPSMVHGRVSRLFTLSQGQLSIQFPPGFAIPLDSDEKLSLWTQLLNLNYRGSPIDVRHLITVDYIPESERKQPLVPLMMTYANVLVSLGENPECKSDDVLDFAGGGMSCAVGAHAQKDGRMNGVYRDKNGKEYTLHWVVPPGRHVYERRMRGLPYLDFDTTVHAIAVHLHPYAEYIELVDATENRLIHRAAAKNPVGKLGLDDVDYYTSTVGMPLARDHEYIVRCGYNNTSNENQDSMAVLFLYCRDRRYDSTVSEEVRTYLDAQGASPLKASAAAIAADTTFQPQPSQSHPLLGKAAPDFNLPDQNDRPTKLKELTKDGPVVLVFYYGYFCDHCVAQLFHLNEDFDRFREIGATIVAVSGDMPALSRQRMSENSPFRFLLCYDSGKVAEAYGTKTGQDVDLMGHMLHGTFLIGRDGKVHWAQTGLQPFLDNKTLLAQLARIQADRQSGL